MQAKNQKMNMGIHHTTAAAAPCAWPDGAAFSYF
jgi:hypothetical protein